MGGSESKPEENGAPADVPPSWMSAGYDTCLDSSLPADSRLSLRSSSEAGRMA